MNLEPIKEALSKATPGPWSYHLGESYTSLGGWEKGYVINEFNDKSIDDAQLVANAPDWIASLVAEVERLRQAKETVLNSHYMLERQLEEAQKTIATAYGIACEDFESVNQMELIRLTLGEFLQSLRGDQP